MHRFSKSLLVITASLLLPSCQFRDNSSRSVVCENYFSLVSDFNHWFPDQGDYMAFLSNGFYETFYDKQDNGYNCHYHLEYKNGQVIDDWGIYTSDGSTLNMSYLTIGERKAVFTKYASPTIDFHIIDTLEYEDKSFKIVYQARYLYSAKG